MSLIQAEFLKNARGDTFIRFFDPAYVRADIIILDRKSKSLFAVLHEQEHFLGDLDEEMMEYFSKCEEVHLNGLLSNKKAVNLKVPLSISE